MHARFSWHYNITTSMHGLYVLQLHARRCASGNVQLCVTKLLGLTYPPEERKAYYT